MYMYIPLSFKAFLYFSFIVLGELLNISHFVCFTLFKFILLRFS